MLFWGISPPHDLCHVSTQGSIAFRPSAIQGSGNGNTHPRPRKKGRQIPLQKNNASRPDGVLSLSTACRLRRSRCRSSSIGRRATTRICFARNVAKGAAVRHRPRLPCGGLLCTISACAPRSHPPWTEAQAGLDGVEEQQIWRAGQRNRHVCCCSQARAKNLPKYPELPFAHPLRCVLRHPPRRYLFHKLLVHIWSTIIMDSLDFLRSKVRLFNCDRAICQFSSSSDRVPVLGFQ